MADILTEITLPSNNMLYGDDVPSKLTIKAMTTKEEKILYGASGDNVFDRVIKACIVEPKGFDLNKLITPDKHAILMKLRIHTYGSEYWVSSKCPTCKTTNEFAVNLDEFTIDELDEDFKEPIEMKLPMSGDKLQCRLLRGSDLDIVESTARKRAKSNKSVKYDELEYVMRMARYIKSINGEEVDHVSATKYVEDMHGRDSAYFWHILNSIKVGYDTTIVSTCPSCGEEHEFSMPINSEFFRPSFR